MRKLRLLFGITIIFSISLFTHCNHKQKEYYFNAKQIENHPDPSQIKIIMQAEPDSSFERLFYGKKRFIQMYYLQDSTEFRFKNGQLLEVIVHKPSLEYDPGSITKFGLKYKMPDEQDSTAFFRWKNQYAGFDVINFYKVGSKKSDRKINYKIFFKLSR